MFAEGGKEGNRTQPAAWGKLLPLAVFLLKFFENRSPRNIKNAKVVVEK
jgi:hypothetical protein